MPVVRSLRERTFADAWPKLPITLEPVAMRHSQLSVSPSPLRSNATDEELPSRTTLNWFVKEDALIDTGYQAIGASARLWYAARDRLHDLRIEPKENQFDSANYFAGMYVHVALERTVPTAEMACRESLYEEHDAIRRVLTEMVLTT